MRTAAKIIQKNPVAVSHFIFQMLALGVDYAIWPRSDADTAKRFACCVYMTAAHLVAIKGADLLAKYFIANIQKKNEGPNNLAEPQSNKPILPPSAISS